MTDAINTNAAIGASAAAAVVAPTAPAAASLTNTPVTSASKKQLVALKVDVTNIKTDSAAKAAIKIAQKKIELKSSEEATETKATEDIEDTATISKAATKASSAQ